MNSSFLARCASTLAISWSITGAAAAQATWVCTGSLPDIDGSGVSDTGQLAIAPTTIISSWDSGFVEQSICEADLCVGHGENFYWIEQVERSGSGEPLELDIIAFSVQQGIPEYPPDSYVVGLSDCSRTTP